MPKKIDLTGQTFNLLTVIKESNKRSPSGSILWECQCKCGKTTYATSTNLKSGHKKSCGCLQKIQASNLGHQNLIDLTNQKFGQLLVLSQAPSKITPNGSKKICWNCLCDCGNKCVVEGQSLKNGNTKSCGCIKSFGEQKISQMLNNANIFYEKEKIFNNCPFRFDFYVDNKYIIEYDGKQHYQDSKWGNNIITVEQQQKRDNEKNNWCKNNNIPIIRIPYYIFQDLSIKDLLLETSKYIIL